MKRLLATAILIIASAQAPLNAGTLSPEFIRGQAKCIRDDGEIVPHKTDYDLGKEAAELINNFEESGKKLAAQTGIHTN